MEIQQTFVILAVVGRSRRSCGGWRGGWKQRVSVKRCVGGQWRSTMAFLQLLFLCYPRDEGLSNIPVLSFSEGLFWGACDAYRGSKSFFSVKITASISYLLTSHVLGIKLAEGLAWDAEAQFLSGVLTVSLFGLVCSSIWRSGLVTEEVEAPSGWICVRWPVACYTDLTKPNKPSRVQPSHSPCYKCPLLGFDLQFTINSGACVRECVKWD